MGIPGEKTASDKLLRYARYHVAALKADPAAAHLGPGVSDAVAALAAQRADTLVAETALIEARARFDRVDYDFDAEVRTAELAVAEAVGKKYAAREYRAVFPSGLSAVVALSGEAQARAVRGAVAALAEQLPDVHQRYGERLLALAAAADDAEGAKKAGEDGLVQARLKEVLARARLREHLYKTRGALEVLYPGSRRRIRSYFLQRRSAALIEEEDAGEPGLDAGGSPT